MKREKIGSFWVDTATVIMGDPCQVLQTDNHDTPTYANLIDKFFPPNPYLELIDKIIECGEHLARKEWLLMQRPPISHIEFLNNSGNVGSIAIMIGTDGWCHVYKETDDEDIVRIILEPGKVEQ